MLAASSRLGPYEIVAPLGAGGMGEVYRARDTRLGREVAVKVLPEPFANNPDRLSRFEREARAVAALSHPNILAIHDYGTHESITYAVMELLEGQTLRGRLGKGPLPWREAVEIGVAIADGLATAHAKGIVHRDLKPENLFLTTDGRVKILDFGLARIAPSAESPGETVPYITAETEAGTVMGTVGYMSPEQVRGQKADAPSDLFSFGCVLYEMVTGQRAFQRESAAETMTAILHEEPPSTTDSVNPFPAELDRLIRQCLVKNPNQRLQSARDLALSLRTTATDPGLQRPVVTQRRSPLTIGIVVALLVVGVVASLAFIFGRDMKPTDLTTTSVEVQSAQSLAVLPFVNEGGDAKTEYLSDGLADHIINSLSQVRRENLKVRPFTSVSRYKSKELDVPTFGRELNVQMMVTGRLQQQGDDLAISVAVIDVREDNQLWGQRYQGKLAGILDLQDQIARDVASQLRLRLTGAEEKSLTKRYTEDPEAYRLYREAMYHLNKFTPEGLASSIKSCRQAIDKDPNYALAHVMMARCLVLRGSLYEGPKKTYPEARAYLAEALKLDPNVPEAHSAMAVTYLFHDWDWSAAERELKRAILLDPNVNLTWNFYGFSLAAKGQLTEALASIQRGLEIDPLSPGRRNELAMCYNWMRQYDRALAEAEKTLELDPNFPLVTVQLAIALTKSDRHQKAIQALTEVLQRGAMSPAVKGMLAYSYATADKPGEARQILEELIGLSQARYGFSFPIARIYAALNEKDQAFEWLRKACDEREPQVIWLKVDPTLDNIRSDPRFAQVLKDMGLPTESQK